MRAGRAHGVWPSLREVGWGVSRRALSACVLLWVLGVVCVGPAAAQAKDASGTTKPVCLFDGKSTTWVHRAYDDGGPPQTSKLDMAPAQKGVGEAVSHWLRLPIELPAKSEFVVPLTETWMGWQELVVDLVLPEGLPQTTVLYVFTKDWDHLWRQVRFPVPEDRGLVRLTIPIAGLAASERWTSYAHYRPWHMLTPGQLLEFGCAIDLDTGATDEFSGEVYLAGAWLRHPEPVADAPTVRRFALSPDYPRLGELCELEFELRIPFTDPFDPENVSVTAAFQTPKGGVETVRGFYYEGFLYHSGAADMRRRFVPYDHPTFRVRYTPRQVGKHSVSAQVSVAGKILELPALSFEVRPAADTYRGFVHVDTVDTRFLVHEDGHSFWGIGMNVRSPFDDRYIATVPYSKWRDEGLSVYDRLFPELQKHGINVVEVWMSSWWLALEWINDAPGFHGVGYMNQYRAWMLDHIVQLAEKHGIYLLLVFNNHGKFGALNDTEWKRSPFNVVNGGFLTSCEEFFTDARAKQAFRKFCDYTIARWGYSPHVMMWKLFTEIDLTGTSYEFYQTPVMAAWHKEMGGYIKQNDLYRHPITTHWMLSYTRINNDVANLPELDVLTTDAYYQGGGTKQMLNLIRGGSTFAKSKNKPLLITEFGGSPHADSMGNLIKQAHLGIWTGFFCGSPAAPLFWWFALVDEKGLYGLYDALHAFTKGEDRTGMTTEVQELPQHGLTLNEVRGDDRLMLWGFDTEYYFSDTENLVPKEHLDVVLTASSLRPGVYTIEYWDVAAGTVSKSEKVTLSQGQPVELHVPPFRQDFAIKVKAAKGE